MERSYIVFGDDIEWRKEREKERREERREEERRGRKEKDTQVSWSDGL